MKQIENNSGYYNRPYMYIQYPTKLLSKRPPGTSGIIIQPPKWTNNEQRSKINLRSVIKIFLLFCLLTTIGVLLGLIPTFQELAKKQAAQEPNKLNLKAQSSNTTLPPLIIVLSTTPAPTTKNEQLRNERFKLDYELEDLNLNKIKSQPDMLNQPLSGNEFHSKEETKNNLKSKDTLREDKSKFEEVEPTELNENELQENNELDKQPMLKETPEPQDLESSGVTSESNSTRSTTGLKSDHKSIDIIRI